MESADRQFRLAKEHYASLTEDEIGALADDAYNLTETGREALAAVISERGLDLKLKTVPAAPPSHLGPCDRLDIDDSELVSYGWAMDEETLKNWNAWLTWAGTACFIGPDKVLEPEDYKGSFADGVNVKIRRVDEQRTAATITRGLREIREKTGEQPEDQHGYEIRCPQCNSAEVVFEGRDCEDSTNPPPNAKFNWSCSDCSHHWKDDGIER
jgi:hypothetical protein